MYTDLHAETKGGCVRPGCFACCLSRSSGGSSRRVAAVGGVVSGGGAKIAAVDGLQCCGRPPPSITGCRIFLLVFREAWLAPGNTVLSRCSFCLFDFAAGLSGRHSIDVSRGTGYSHGKHVLAHGMHRIGCLPDDVLTMPGCRLSTVKLPEPTFHPGSGVDFMIDIT